MNAALNHISAAQLQADALRAALRNPPVAAIAAGPPRSRRRSRRLLFRLRPALA